MPVCVAAVQNASGAFVLQLDPAQTDISQCTYVIEDGASNAWRELGNMSIENATQIGMAVAAVWAVAWGVKQIARMLHSNEDASEL